MGWRRPTGDACACGAHARREKNSSHATEEVLELPPPRTQVLPPAQRTLCESAGRRINLTFRSFSTTQPQPQLQLQPQQPQSQQPQPEDERPRGVAGASASSGDTAEPDIRKRPREEQEIGNPA